MNSFILGSSATDYILKLAFPQTKYQKHINPFLGWTQVKVKSLFWLPRFMQTANLRCHNAYMELLRAGEIF